MQRIHLRNEAKTATLERLVPHLGTLEAVRDQLHEAKEQAKKTEKELRERIAQLQDSNFELSGSSKGKLQICPIDLCCRNCILNHLDFKQCKPPRWPKWKNKLKPWKKTR